LNPARLSEALAALYPPGIAAADLLGPAPAGLLTEDELHTVSHCAPKRIADFSAGRLCAHRALREFGVESFSLLSAPDRLPRWPQPLTGSITHTEGYSAAVVGRREDFRGLGVDCETIASVHAELWPRILGGAELERLQGLPLAARETTAALMFAAKEAFYKCQFPLTREWLEFEDVEIECAHWDAPTGCFSVRPQRRLHLQDEVAGPITGRFRRHAPFVSCAVALPA
jgi:4'-phosphopantetheinyl transferase EntD